MLIECSFKAIHLTTGSLKDRFISRHQAKTCQQSTTTVDPPTIFCTLYQYVIMNVRLSFLVSVLISMPPVCDT